MSEQIVTKPIINDETGQQMLDKLDEIISALNPNAQGVSFDKTGCEIITANNAQDALTQLDTAVDSVSSNLAHKLFTLNYASVTVPINNGANVTPTNSIPSGYTAIGVRKQTTGDLSVIIRGYDLSNGTLYLRNVSTAEAKTVTPSIEIVLVSSSIVSNYS